MLSYVLEITLDLTNRDITTWIMLTPRKILINTVEVIAVLTKLKNYYNGVPVL